MSRHAHTPISALAIETVLCARHVFDCRPAHVALVLASKGSASGAMEDRGATCQPDFT